MSASVAIAKQAPAPVAAVASTQLIPGIDLAIALAIAFGLLGGIWFTAAQTLEIAGWVKARAGLVANAMRFVMLFIVATALYEFAVPLTGLVNIKPGLSGAALIGGIVGAKGAGAVDWALEKMGIVKPKEERFPDYTTPPDADPPKDIRDLNDRLDKQ